MDKFYRRNVLSVFIYFLISLFSADLLAQTGPGGIGNANGSNGEPKLEMWYDASDIALANNALIDSWMDRSGNGNNISQTGAARPTYKSSADANYSFSSVRFDGVDDFLPIDGSLLVNTNYTVIVVAARRQNNVQAIMGGATTGNNENFHPYFNTNQLHSHQWGNDHNANYTGGPGSTVNATTPNFGVFAFRLNSNLGSAQRAMYQNGELIGTLNNNAQLISYNEAALGRIEAINSFSQLDLAEVIVYSTALSEPQLAIVNNYLSSKYNLNMNSNDYYAGDTPANNNFDLNVTGIGQLAGVKVNTSISQGVSFEGRTNLNANGEFLMMGTNATVNSISTANLGATVQSRWNKTWYFDKSGDLDAKISFDLIEGIGGLYPSGDKNNYVLLRLSGGTYNIVPINPADKSLVGSKIEFSVNNANLTDGVYTLGTINSAESPVDGQPNQTWYSYQTGNWSNPLTWTTDGSGQDRVPSGGGIPDASDNVVILSGDDITMDINNVVVTSIEVNGELDLVATTGHNFIDIAGNGTIRLSGAGGFDNFPLGNIDDFADDFIGGTVEYYGNGVSLNQNRVFNNLIVNMNTNATELVLLSDLNLYGNFTINRGTFKINNNSAANVLTLNIEKDAFVNTNGLIRVGEGNVKGAFSIPGTMPATGNYHGIFHQVIMKGDFTNRGSVRFTNQTSPGYNQFTNNGAATVRFEGNTSNIVSLFGQTDFYNLIINKGIDQTYELEINSTNVNNFSLFGPNNVGRISNGGFTEANPEVRKALWIRNGTLHLTGRLNIPTLSEGNTVSGNGDYPIPSTGALWIDGVNVSVYSTADDAPHVPAGATGVNGGGGNQALSLYGKFRITNGFFGTRGSAGFIFWNASAGEILIEGGTVNVSQFRAGQGGTSTNTYTQTGGNVIVRANSGIAGETNGDYALFSLHLPEGFFNMSGGTLQIYGDTGNGSFFVNSAPGNFSVTGGDVIVENRNGNRSTIASTAPVWNLTLLRGSGGNEEIDLLTETSGGATITNPTLKVLNNFSIGENLIFDHNGNRVEVGSDFTVSNNATYVFDETKPNTLVINGVDNSKIALLNIAGGGGAGEVQQFYNLIIDKPHGKVVSLQSSKPASNLTGFRNNLFRVDGEAFKLLSGTLDQGVHSILANCDTLVNYDVLTVYNEALGPTGPNGTDANANGNNDQLKLAANQGTPTDIVVITADTAVIGNLKFFMEGNIVTLNSDLTIQYLEHNNGRLNIETHNLKVSFYNENVTGGPSSIDTRGVQDMVVTSGNVSDGGLSLRIRASTTYLFPIGIGLTGVNPTSKYTPASLTLNNVTDDGYITVRPVDQVLPTTNRNGGTMLSYYWRISHDGFATLPNVVSLIFTGNEDDDGTGNANNFPNSWRGGKVLSEVPFTRSAEDNTSINTPNGHNINFDGNGTPFPVENADYSAGPPNRFNGAPQIYYTRGLDRQNIQPLWTDPATWTRSDRPGFDPNNPHSSSNPASTDVPSEGSIVNIGFFPYDDPQTVYRGYPHSVRINGGNAEAAAIIFTQMTDAGGNAPVERKPISEIGGENEFQFRPTFTWNSTGTILINSIQGEGTIRVRGEGTNNAQRDPDFSNVDLGLFINQDSAYILYEAFNNYTINNLPSISPNLMISANNYGQVDQTVTINKNFQTNQNLEIQGNTNVVLGNGAGGDAVIGGNLYLKPLTDNVGGGELRLLSSGTARRIEIGGNVLVGNATGAAATNGNIIRVENGGNVDHLMIVKGNIILNTNGNNSGNGNGLRFGDGTGSTIKLNLEGESDNFFENVNGNVPQLYQVTLNKGNSKTYSFTFNDDINIPDANAAYQPLEILNGTLILDDSNIDVLIANGSNFYLPNTLNVAASSGSGELRLLQGLLRVAGDNTGIMLDGTLDIAGGTIDMASGVGNGNNFIEYSGSGSALLNISSGSLTVGSQIRRNLNTPAGVLKYQQTGGTVIVGQNAAPEASRGIFEISNTGSEFTYTGGSLTLVRQNTATPTVAALRLLPSSSNITQTIFIGNGDTPAGQNNFGINANVPLAGLEISGFNSPTAIIQVNPLVLNDELLINNGATLNANAIDLVLNADFTNNGNYVPASNTTRFASTTAQSFGGTGTTSFFRFIKTNDGTLIINRDITVNNLFSLLDGILSDNGNTIDLKGNAVIDGQHSGTSGNGIQFSATTQQQLLRSGIGNSRLGVVTITNPAGVIIPESNGYNFTIEGGLQMNGGIFNIGSSEIVIEQNAEITTNSSFSVSNMIKTNSSFTDNGLTKVFPSGYNQTFTYPIGEDSYTPVIADFSMSGGSAGSTVGRISARPANEYHPTVNNDTDFFSSGDINNVLQYYWTLKSENVTNMVGSIDFHYDQSDVSVSEPGFTEADYIAARILSIGNPLANINKYNDSNVDEVANIIEFNQTIVFNGVGSSSIAGDYFAGIDQAIPNNVATYTSTGTGGNVTADATFIETLPTDGVAPSGSILIVSNGTEVDFNVGNVRLYKTIIEDGGILNIEGTDGHRLGVLEGTGTLKISSNTNNATLPAADYADFFSCAGGGLEYAGTGSYNVLAGITSLRNLTFSGSGNRNFPNNDVIICEDLVIDGPNAVMEAGRNIEIQRDLQVNNGNLTLATGNGTRIEVLNDVFVNGGTLNGAPFSSATIDVRGDLNISGGLFFMDGTITELKGDFVFTSGTIDAGTSTLLMNSTSNSQRFVGNITGANSLYSVTLNNGTGTQDFQAEGNLELINQLDLTDGRLLSGNNTVYFRADAIAVPANGKSTSYITGKVTKTISSAGGNFTFPIGNVFRWRPATVSNVSGAGLTWEAQYFTANPTSHPLVDNLTQSTTATATISNNEYWIISDGPSAPAGVTARVGLSWGIESEVSTEVTERAELQVMAWNDATSRWNNFGGGSFSAGNTQAQGSFLSASNITFSERILTLGSGDESNPLPVELVFFTAENQNTNVELEWQTASEFNNDFFEVQRSFDGEAFEVIGIVEGNGTVNQLISYGFTDYSPLAGETYYRLRQVDYNGDYEYSPIAKVNREEVSDLTLVPNPTSDQAIYLRLSGFHGEQSVQVKIFDLQGKLYYSNNHSPNELQQKPLPIRSTMHAGIYMVEVVQGNTVKQVRLAIR